MTRVKTLPIFCTLDQSAKAPSSVSALGYYVRPSNNLSRMIYEQNGI